MMPLPISNAVGSAVAETGRLTIDFDWSRRQCPSSGRTIGSEMPTVLSKQPPARPLLWSRRALMRVRHRLGAQHAGKAVAAAKVGVDDIAVCAERFAQRRDLDLEVFFRHHDPRPHPTAELLFCDERAVGL